MWKESYRIGVPAIDEQHYALFQTVDRLFRTIRDDQEANCSEVYADIIDFMQQYVARHFAEEEMYQAAIGYAGLDAHRREHRAFTRKIAAFGERFVREGYQIASVKEFAGTLAAWLIYHVAEADQRFAHPETMEKLSLPEQYLDCFTQSAADVLQKMAGAQLLDAKKTHQLEELVAGDIAVRLEFVGDTSLAVEFAFPKEMALGLFRTMTFMEVSAIDELVCSAMAELVNIASGNVATALQARGVVCDIKPPALTVGGAGVSGAPGVYVRTDAGHFGIALHGA